MPFKQIELGIGMNFLSVEISRHSQLFRDSLCTFYERGTHFKAYAYVAQK